MFEGSFGHTYIYIYIYRKSAVCILSVADCARVEEEVSFPTHSAEKLKSKKPSNFSAECVGKLTSSSTLAQSATLRIHTASNQPRTHLRSKS